MSILWDNRSYALNNTETHSTICMSSTEVELLCTVNWVIHGYWIYQTTLRWDRHLNTCHSEKQSTSANTSWFWQQILHYLWTDCKEKALETWTTNLRNLLQFGDRKLNSRKGKLNTNLNRESQDNSIRHLLFIVSSQVSTESRIENLVASWRSKRV